MELKFRAYNENLAKPKSNEFMDYSESHKSISDFFKKNRDISNSAKCYFMQFTGLQDVSSRDIYEGDILVSASETNGNRYKIVYDNELCAFMLSFKTLSHYMESHSDLKIIGNIYENPELI